MARFSKCSHKCLEQFGKGQRECEHRQKDHMSTEADWMSSQTKKTWQPPEDGASRRGFSPKPLESLQYLDHGLA